MLVANFVSCSIVRLHQVATMGCTFLPVLSVDVICRDPGASYVAPAAATLQELVDARVDGDDPEAKAGDVEALEIPPETYPLEVISTAPLPHSPPLLRRSPRLALIEEASYVSVMERASRCKRSKLEGKRGPSRLGLLPAKELLEMAGEGFAPLDPMDVGLLAKACDAVI
jgi:hypothetical protein